MSKVLYPMLDPTAYLKLAEEVSSNSETAARRTAADRAYFAAFLVSRDLLAEKGYMLPHYSDEDHKDVVDVLKDMQVLGAFGNEENRLRMARNCVTYDTRDLDSSMLRNVRSLEWMLYTAREIIKRVKALPENPKSSRGGAGK
jgi:hypothetical protein